MLYDCWDLVMDVMAIKVVIVVMLSLGYSHNLCIVG